MAAITTAHDQKRRCEAQGCDRLIQVRMLMCATHWRLVPTDLQRDVYRTHRALTQGPSHQRLSSVAAYRQAVNAAVTSITQS